MTTPDLSFIIPTKYKPWVGALGALLTFIVPTLTEVVAELDQPWPAVFAAVLAGLTWLGIYKVPYAPSGTVLAPDTPAVREAAVEPPSGGRSSSWA